MQIGALTVLGIVLGPRAGRRGAAGAGAGDRGGAAVPGRLRALPRAAGRGGALRRAHGAAVHPVAAGADRARCAPPRSTATMRCGAGGRPRPRTLVATARRRGDAGRRRRRGSRACRPWRCGAPRGILGALAVLLVAAVGHPAAGAAAGAVARVARAAPRCGWRWARSAGRGARPRRSSCRSASGLRCWRRSARSTATCAAPSPATCRHGRRAYFFIDIQPDQLAGLP